MDKKRAGVIKLLILAIPGRAYLGILQARGTSCPVGDYNYPQPVEIRSCHRYTLLGPDDHWSKYYGGIGQRRGTDVDRWVQCRESYC